MKSLSRSILPDAPLYRGGELSSFNLRTHLFCARVLFGLNRPIGQSLIRALRHIIEFDSGLLIRLSDLRLRPGP
jgi:hypothetical protein